MRQRWGGLLFLHWPVPAGELRRLVPEPLEIETFDGSAWIGITPFFMWDLAPPHLPALPLLSRSLEINVRTYVRLDGEPGIWFFSLDAENPLFVWGARLGFHLPYFRARMHREIAAGETVRFSSQRLRCSASPIRGGVASWGTTSSAGAGQPRLLSHRALSPVRRRQGPSFQCPHPPPALVAARSRPGVARLHPVRIRGSAVASGSTPAARAGETAESPGLAAKESPLRSTEAVSWGENSGGRAPHHEQRTGAPAESVVAAGRQFFRGTP